MALVLLGSSSCVLCGQVLADAENLVSIPAVPLSEPAIARFADAAFHATCFRAWPLRPALVAQINSYFDAHYRGMRFMTQEGAIEDREPRSGRSA
jgi:hypothetical protein